jgi:zinc protease
VEALKTTPPTQAELMKARNQLLSSTLNARETNEGLALALGEAAVYQNDPQRVNTEIAELLAVTGEDIQRVARQFFTLQNRLVVRYQSGGDALKGGSLRSPQISNAPALPPVTVNPATKGSKQTPPAPGKPRSATLPTPTEMRLTSGLRVVVISAPGSGLVTAQVTVLSGGASDPKELPGLADFTASLLTRGTQARTAPQIAEQIEALGGSLSSSAGWDSSNVSLSVLSTNLPQALPILADVVRNPAFAPDEINRLRTQSVDDLQVRLQEPGTLARYVAAQLTFGSGPYAHPLGGTVTSLKRVSRNDITRFYTNYYRPDNSVLVIGGDIAPSTAFAEAERVFGNWAVSSPPTDLPKRGAGAQTGRVVVIDKPDAGQAAVVLSRPGLARSAPHYYVGAVANSVFGGGYSSRLNQEVRIKRGLSYGAFSNLDARLLTGPFVASVQTKNESADEVATLLQSELARLGSGTLSSQELETRKAALSGNYARSLETGAGLVTTVSGLLERGIAPGAIQEYLPKVQQVTSEQVRAFAARRLSPQTANLVIAGNASKFLPALRKRYKNVQVIRAAKLNLDQNNLAK